MIPKSFVGQIFSIVFIIGFGIQLLSILYSQWLFGRLRVCNLSTEPIDAVYTWVNGSDPDFIQSLNDYKRGSVQASRYRDFDQLLYSLRSIEQYAPWIRHVYIVTNGQVPYWLDLSFERVTIVTHDEIYRNRSHLPTFSSPSIETNLHRISNLSERFIYLNDDISFINPVCPDDYFNENGQKIYFFTSIFKGHPSSHEIFNFQCPRYCENLADNGHCDPECNLFACGYDDSDCDGVDSSLADEYQNSRELFYKSIDFTNLLFTRKLNLNNKWRKWIPHYPFMFQKSIISQLQSKLEKEYNITSGHRFRSKNDIQIAFAYFHYLNEWNSNLLPQNTIENGENYGVYIGLRPGGLKQALENYLRPNFFLPYKYGLKYLWICVNDNLDPDHPDFLSAINLVKNWYNSVYPLPSRFEKIETAAQSTQNSKTSGKELNIKTELVWLTIILIQSFLFFVFLPFSWFKYSHLFLNLKNRILGYRFLKS